MRANDDHSKSFRHLWYYHFTVLSRRAPSNRRSGPSTRSSPLGTYCCALTDQGFHSSRQALLRTSPFRLAYCCSYTQPPTSGRNRPEMMPTLSYCLAHLSFVVLVPSFSSRRLSLATPAVEIVLKCRQEWT